MGTNHHKVDLADVVGQKIRMLTVLRFSHVEKATNADRIRNKYMYICLCDCGKETLVNRFHLKQKNSASATWSCGCYQKQQSLAGHEKQKGKWRPSVQKPNGIAMFNTILAAYKNGAKKRNLSFNLTNSQFETFTKQNCYYCEAQPRLIKKKDSFSSRLMNGIDRLNSNIGYEFDNCVPCCKICNLMKSAQSLESFLKQIHKIANKHPLKSET